MKKQSIVALALLVGSLSYAQKDEIKAAEKAIKSGNFADAKTAILSAESLISNSDAKMQAKYYYVKGQALYANGTASNVDIDTAIKSFNTVKDIEEASGKAKYTSDIDQLQQVMLSDFITRANKALEKEDYMGSSKEFEKAYSLSPVDTSYLYYAASTAVTAQDYDVSLQHYLTLRDLGYEGIETQYTAINKESNEKEVFGSAVLRDLSVKSGTHIKPEVNKTSSKSAEIVKNIALIYITKGDNEKAIEAMKDAREKNPDDLGLLMSEANIQLKMGNRDEFKRLMEEATTKDPNNAELQYNLGVIAADAGDIDDAKKYYEKALELEPDNADASNNMAVLILGQEKGIFDKMNSLGTSSADYKKYDAYKEELNVLYKSAIPYLEKTLKLKPTHVNAAKTLMSIYSSLGETDKFKVMKAKVEALESGN
ncbi:tetratricopeptide repeat protein [Lacinutrix undariae]